MSVTNTEHRAASARAALRVLVTGGGTGGHINPGLAVISELRSRRPDAEFLWVGTRDRLEANLVPKANVPIEFVDVAFLKGRGLFGKLMAAAKLPKALWQAWRFVRRFRPHVIVGVGGFASGPVGLAGRLSGVPTVILEQNARPGLTNRVLGKVASRVFTSFDEASDSFRAKKVRFFGNPVRPELLDTERGTTQDGPSTVNLLVIGGSQGATSLNRDLPAVLNKVAEHLPSLAVKHSAGRGRTEEVSRAYAGAEFAEVVEYIDNMKAAYEWADFVVARAGATTVAELTALGIPAMYVPFPAAADNHQEKNALSIVSRDGGLMATDKELADPESAERIAAQLCDVLEDSALLSRMSEAARGLGKPSAGAMIADEILSLAEVK
ncbi:MAG: undecaprenyldiphospho-muramoylpentapeptide beta-N-acetylglucosaminyltransferase [Myxococcales bacterium]|nr:undecaprenyldiphospho-muramoylpentapeptide beta-N-acetylglucosaminyltransferase [Myxococcales bacterium]